MGVRAEYRSSAIAKGTIIPSLTSSRSFGSVGLPLEEGISADSKGSLMLVKFVVVESVVIGVRSRRKLDAATDGSSGC